MSTLSSHMVEVVVPVMLQDREKVLALLVERGTERLEVIPGQRLRIHGSQRALIDTLTLRMQYQLTDAKQASTTSVRELASAVAKLSRISEEAIVTRCWRLDN